MQKLEILREWEGPGNWVAVATALIVGDRLS